MTARSDCEAQVINFKGAKYKKFLHAADAELWVHQNAVGPYATPKTSPVAAPNAAPQVGVNSPETREPSSPRAPSSKAASSSAKTRDTSPSLRGGERAISEELQVIPQHSTQSSTGSRESITTTMSSNTLIVYTDGSCRGNGKVGNISERCPGQQTNNRAELIAIIRVLETTPRDRPILIKSDSEYSIKSMTEWIWTWKARGWRTSSGSAVLNLPVIKYLDILLEERRRVLKQSVGPYYSALRYASNAAISNSPPQVEFDKVPAHSGLEGNEGADILAKAGATLPPVPDLDWEALSQKAEPATSSAEQEATSIVNPPQQCQPCVVDNIATVVSVAGYVDLFNLNLNLRFHFWTVDAKISQEEKEAFAACWLDDDDFLREAQEAGL
ncbi:hypothetical protein GSI_10564 [Ganoderma sinense ZZ0214-1]|uniref:ribonuclease H n=1 Tax=Ganoderma sinense ZZ0214-1 TaxID=1077348 RepID=A0A2G8S0W9_9APHY|nr:hypothetical protein GSI_10564 [Ganoderma sinense ZZ0214-1]